jgi:hypothetical protein
MAEQASLRKDAGLDTNEATQQYRSDLMAERANAGKEKERQSYLRAAEFFAHWGSTPGPVIAAGLTALKETMPGYLEDIKDQKKLKKELDKGIFEMNQADRLEQQGYMKEAAAIKEKASDALMKHHNLYAEAMLNKETEDKKIASQEKIAAAGDLSTVQSAQIRAGASGSGLAGDRYKLNVLNAQRQSANARLTGILKANSDIPPEEGQPGYAEYIKAVNTVNTLDDKIQKLESSGGGTAEESPDTTEDTGMTVENWG